jgi:hypothetical protein
MAKKRAAAAIELSEGPNEHRAGHDNFTREIKVTPPGAPLVVRYRVRPVLTPPEARRAIMDDVASKAETVRVRSLARRLSRLDRALSCPEASALYRIVNAINDVCNIGCINYGDRVQSDPRDRLPFSEAREREMRLKAAFVKTRLNSFDRFILWQFASWLDASYEGKPPKVSDDFIAHIKIIAQATLTFYQELGEKRRA